MRKHRILNLCVVALVVGTVVIAAACGGQNGGKPTAEVPSQNQPEVGVPTDDQRQTAAPVENERTGNPQVLADIPVGSQPVGIALNPVTNRVYVANSKSASVSVIDARTDSVVATVPVDDWPWGVAVNPTTNRIYVTSSSDNVTVIDGATNAVATVPAGAGSRAVAVNPATNRVYVANTWSDSISVIDGATNNPIATISVDGSPRGVAVDPTTGLPPKTSPPPMLLVQVASGVAETCFLPTAAPSPAPVAGTPVSCGVAPHCSAAASARQAPVPLRAYRRSPGSTVRP